MRDLQSLEHPTGLPDVEPPNEDLRNALAILLCWSGKPLPVADAEAVRRRIELAVSKLEGRPCV